MTASPSPPIAEVGKREAWLRERGWMQAPNGTWGLPQSTCRSVSAETAFHIGTILESIDNE